MGSYMIATGSITYAIKGRDTLRRHGHKARIERKSSGFSSGGCGYGIVFEGNINEAEKILKNAGIKMLGISSL